MFFWGDCRKGSQCIAVPVMPGAAAADGDSSAAARRIRGSKEVLLDRAPPAHASPTIWKRPWAPRLNAVTASRQDTKRGWSRIRRERPRLPLAPGANRTAIATGPAAECPRLKELPAEKTQQGTSRRDRVPRRAEVARARTRRVSSSISRVGELRNRQALRCNPSVRAHSVRSLRSRTGRLSVGQRCGQYLANPQLNIVAFDMRQGMKRDSRHEPRPAPICRPSRGALRWHRVEHQSGPRGAEFVQRGAQQSGSPLFPEGRRAPNYYAHR